MFRGSRMVAELVRRRDRPALDADLKLQTGVWRKRSNTGDVSDMIKAGLHLSRGSIFPILVVIAEN